MEDQIIPTCKLIGGLLACLVAPQWLCAQDVDMGDTALSLYARAQLADAEGDSQTAARLYAKLVEDDAAGAADLAIANAIEAGDFALARSVLGDLPAEDMNIAGRLLQVMDRLEVDDERAARRILEAPSERVSLSFITPFFDAWAGDPAQGAAALVRLDRRHPLAAYVDEHRGLLLLHAGRFDAAQPVIERALLNAGGREGGMRINFARLYKAAGQGDAARALLTNEDGASLPLSIVPDAGPRRVSQGLATLLSAFALTLTRNGNEDLGLALSQVARAGAPSDGHITLLTALLLENAQREQQALDLYGDVPMGSPWFPEALEGRVRLLVAMDRADEAIASVENARGGTDRRLRTDVRLGEIYSSLERWDDAADAFARARAGADSDDWTIPYMEGAMRDRAGEYERSESLFREALAIAPKQAVILNHYGYSLLEQGRQLDRAEALIRAAHAAEPDNPSITDSLGWLLFKRGRFEKALSKLEEAASSDDVSATVQEHYGDALYASNDPIAARFAWQLARLKAADEDDAEARTARIDDKLRNGLMARNEAP